MNKPLARLLFCAPASGSGKTTMTCAVLRALIRRGLSVAAFKCGPDYIDPMFHRACTGAVASGNLDLFFTDERQLSALLAQQAGDAALAVAEGAMGYYDGIAGGFEASAYTVARAAQFPAVLVVNCKGMAASIAAQVKGFTELRRDSGIAAVLLNRLSPALYPEIRALVERECGVPVAGYLPPMPDCVFKSRHLGLIGAQEITDLQQTLDRLAAQAEQTIDLALLLRLAQNAPPLACGEDAGVAPPASDARVRIAVARDRAFCFYYEETLALLRRLGAELCEFSPLIDKTLPEDCGGLLLGGGYPELYAAQLSKNHLMLASIRAAIGAGMPTIAECGGFLYLHRSLENTNAQRFEMAGIIDADAVKADKLGRFGYVTLCAKQENLLCDAGETLRAHTFHYWRSTDEGDAFRLQKAGRDLVWDAGYATASLYAGFAHLYLVGASDAAARFVDAAALFHAREDET